MQGIVGMAITMVYFLGLKDVAPFSGLLLYGIWTRTGQANNIGYMSKQPVYSRHQTFGLSVSTLGLCGHVSGVWYLNYLQKKTNLNGFTKIR